MFVASSHEKLHSEFTGLSGCVLVFVCRNVTPGFAEEVFGVGARLRSGMTIEGVFLRKL